MQVIENSGYGADKFTMVRNNDGTGSLKIVQPLDYEDLLQSNGFRFRIQVNDKGEDNDNDKYHVAYSWVVVKLRDINDNKPVFERPNIEVSVPENAEIGKSLDTFKATDPDQGGKSKVTAVYFQQVIWCSNSSIHFDKKISTALFNKDIGCLGRKFNKN